MTPDQYLTQILKRETVSYGILSEFYNCIQILEPHLRNWANGHLLNTCLSGSYAKGTAIVSGTDLDIFISLSENLKSDLRQIYNSLFLYMKKEGFSTKKQNVSIGINLNGFDIDLVPAQRQGSIGNDHSLYDSRNDSWIKTNISTHVELVSKSGLIEEIKLLKIWRNQKKLQASSFFLELIAIKVLSEKKSIKISDNFFKILEYISANIENVRIIDPANTNNNISETLTRSEKDALMKSAKKSICASNWADIIK
jgi:hypothetical protein